MTVARAATSTRPASPTPSRLDGRTGRRFDEFAAPDGTPAHGLDRPGRRASRRPPDDLPRPAARSPGCWRTTTSPTRRARPRRARSPTRRPGEPRRAAAAGAAASPGGSTRCRWCCTTASGRRSRPAWSSAPSCSTRSSPTCTAPAGCWRAASCPPAVVLDHEEYLRPVVGAESVVDQRLFMTAADLGRDATGAWKVISDRTQAPSGAGYAMQNRRVVSRVLPEALPRRAPAPADPVLPGHAGGAGRVGAQHGRGPPRRRAEPGHALRDRVRPGVRRLAARLPAARGQRPAGPRRPGLDAGARQARAGRRHPAPRRLRPGWTPLELRGGSRLGVTGLLECVRQGTVSVVNTIGSGVLENPALLPFLPELCERLLGEPLRLPSVDTWWCGDPEGRAYVLDHLDELVVRPINRGHGRSVVGAALTREQRERLVARIEAEPAPLRRPGGAAALVGAGPRPTAGGSTAWSGAASCCARSPSAAAARTRRCSAGSPGRRRGPRRPRRRWSPPPTAAWPRTSGSSAASRCRPRARRDPQPGRRGQRRAPGARPRRRWCRACSATSTGSAATPSAPRTCCAWSWPAAR